MRPGFINSFQPARDPVVQQFPSTPLESYEYAGGWPGTIDNTGYVATFTGFDTPSAETPLESYEYAGGWPGTIDNTGYVATFTGFDTPSAETPLESYEYAGGWPGT